MGRQRKGRVRKETRGRRKVLVCERKRWREKGRQSVGRMKEGRGRKYVWERQRGRVGENMTVRGRFS